MKNLITRETWLSLLAQASVEELDSLRNTMQPNQKIQVMKTPVAGTTLVRARMGNTGNQFNAFEVVTTKCVIKSERGIIGYGWRLGDCHEEVELAAILDSELQIQPEDSLVWEQLHKISQRLSTEHLESAKLVASTRVDFTTMVRGE
jgi:alpha-D-ribose 1-methylphosphonate 5-triphosphate synthase subunit PhnG